MSAAVGAPVPSRYAATTVLAGAIPAHSPARSAPSRSSATYQSTNATAVTTTASQSSASSSGPVGIGSGSPAANPATSSMGAANPDA